MVRCKHGRVNTLTVAHLIVAVHAHCHFKMHTEKTSISSSNATPTPLPVSGGLLSLPPELTAWRTRLFTLSAPIYITRDQLNQYWPYVDNYWVRNKRSKPLKDGSYTEYWWCRLHSKEDHLPTTKQRQRMRSARTAVACEMKLKIVHRGMISIHGKGFY